MDGIYFIFFILWASDVKASAMWHAGEMAKEEEDDRACGFCSFHSEMASYFHFHFIAQCEVQSQR